MPKIVLTDTKDLEKFKNIAEGNYIKNITESSKVATKGAVVGLLGGLVVAMLFKKSYIFCGLAGAIIGGVFAHNVIYKISKKLENVNNNNNNGNNNNDSNSEIDNQSNLQSE